VHPQQACPDENALSSWVEGRCEPTDAEVLARHVESCDACREVFALLAQGSELGPTTPRPLGPPRSPVVAGQLVGGSYEILEVLGAGGMGVVVRARHQQLNSLVALKFIRPELAHDPDVVSRFSREARAASRLKSPHANRVFDLGALPDGTPYMVMEFLSGETLEARLLRQGPLPELEVRRWMSQALDALTEAHALGIVHRDLKPANLFLQRRPDGADSLVVLDFGVAKSVNPDIEAGLQQTAQRALVGSPAYMAPEQLTGGEPVDARTDLWALGCTMYALLTGHTAFHGRDLLDVAWQIRNAAPAELPTELSAAMRACVRRCLEKAPGQRFQTTGELAAALAQIDRDAPLVPRSRGLLWVSLAVAVAVAGGAAWVLRAPPDLAPGPAASSPPPPPRVEVAAPSVPIEPPPSAPPTFSPAPPEPGPRPARRPPAAAIRAAPPRPLPDAGSADVFDERL
jgi:serine/threonine-protein kinase